MNIDSTRFRECVIKALKLRPGQYRPNLRMGDVDEWDSVAHLDLMSEMEREFGVQLNLDEMTTLTTLPDLLEWLERAK